ncbi:MAG: hypothetical protein KTR26_03885 [Flammeovirgaceae bacterium]|nr:hypothetical protein [Flammeovirgaceae bacterium]
MNNIIISIFALIGIPRYREFKNSNYGREDGWYIELKGEVLGELIECKWEDMFWDSYEIHSIAEDKEKSLFDTKLWDNNRFDFRNKKFNNYAKFAFPSGIHENITIGKGQRIRMRGLYILKP